MWSSRRVVIIIVLFMTNGSHGSVGQPARQCQRDNDNFHWDLELSCEGDAKIRIVDAYWGRRQPAVDDAYNVTEGFCPCYGCYGQLPDQRRDQNTHCTTGDPDVDAEITKHVRELVEDKCDNKPSCSIEPKFEELKEPCSDTYKYLEVQYYCSATPPESTTETPPDVTTEPPPDVTTGPPPDVTTGPPPDVTTGPPTKASPHRCCCEGRSKAKIVPFNGWPASIKSKQKTLIASFKSGTNDPCKYKIRAITRAITHNLQGSKTEYFVLGLYVSFGIYAKKKKVPTDRHLKIGVRDNRPSYRMFGGKIKTSRPWPIKVGGPDAPYVFPDRRTSGVDKRVNHKFKMYEMDNGTGILESDECPFTVTFNVADYENNGIQFKLCTNANKTAYFNGFCDACNERAIVLDEEHYSQVKTNKFKLEDED